jgi:hypothetical protein
VGNSEFAARILWGESKGHGSHITETFTPFGNSSICFPSSTETLDQTFFSAALSRQQRSNPVRNLWALVRVHLRAGISGFSLYSCLGSEALQRVFISL